MKQEKSKVIKKFDKINPSQLLLAIVIFYWMSLYTYPSLLTPYLSEIGATLTQAGLIVGSYGFTQMILRFPLGVYADHIGKKKIFIVLGMITSLISSLGFIFTQNVWLILILRSLAGVSASFWVQITSLYINYSTDSTKAVSQLNFTNNLGLIIGIFLGGQVISRFGYKYGFVLGAILAVIGLVLSLLLPAEEPAQTNKIKISENNQNKRRFNFIDKGLIWGSIFAAFSQYLTFSTSQGFIAQHADMLGASAAEISLMSTINTIARIIVIVLVYQVLLRFFTIKHILVGSMLLYALFIFFVPFISNYYWLYLIMFLMGMSSGTQMTYFMDVATRHIESHYKSSAMGFYQAVYGIGMVVGPAITGFVADISSISLAFISVGIVGLISTVLMIVQLPNE